MGGGVARAQLGVRRFRRFSMRGEAGWGGEVGLPHGRTWCVTTRSDSAPVVCARYAFWHPVRDADACVLGWSGGVASLDPRLISGALSGQVLTDVLGGPGEVFSRLDTQRADTEVLAPAALVVGPVDGGLRLGVQWADKPNGSSPRARPCRPHPALSHSDVATVDRTSSRGRGGTRGRAAADVGQVYLTCPGRDDGVGQTKGVGR